MKERRTKILASGLGGLGMLGLGWYESIKRAFSDLGLIPPELAFHIFIVVCLLLILGSVIFWIQFGVHYVIANWNANMGPMLLGILGVCALSGAALWQLRISVESENDQRNSIHAGPFTIVVPNRDRTRVRAVVPEGFDGVVSQIGPTIAARRDDGTFVPIFLQTTYLLAVRNNSPDDRTFKDVTLEMALPDGTTRRMPILNAANTSMDLHRDRDVVFEIAHQYTTDLNGLDLYSHGTLIFAEKPVFEAILAMIKASGDHGTFSVGNNDVKHAGNYRVKDILGIRPTLPYFTFHLSADDVPSQRLFLLVSPGEGNGLRLELKTNQSELDVSGLGRAAAE